MEKICLVSPFPPPYGGIANWSNMIKSHYDKSGEYELKIIDIAPKTRSTEGRGIFSRVFVSGFQMLKINKQLKKTLKSGGISLIHMTTSAQLAILRDILLLKTAKKYKVPVVYHLHFGRVPEISKANTKEWRLLKKAAAAADTVIAIDNASLSALKEYCPEANAVFVPNPIDLSELPAPKEGEKTVAYLGWVIPTKGIDELITAWNTVGKNHSDYKLVIIGPYKGEYLDELKKKISVDNIEFLGEKPHGEAMQLINKAQIFTLPSYTEGFPCVITEAMALKKAIAATDVGAIPEMLSGGCGVTFPPRDADALKNALEELISDPEKRKTVSENAYKRLKENYTAEKVTAMLETVWRDVKKERKSYDG